MCVYSVELWFSILLEGLQHDQNVSWILILCTRKKSEFLALKTSSIAACLIALNTSNIILILYIFCSVCVCVYIYIYIYIYKSKSVNNKLHNKIYFSTYGRLLQQIGLFFTVILRYYWYTKDVYTPHTLHIYIYIYICVCVCVCTFSPRGCL